MIRQATYPELKTLYKQRITKDFPPDERRPLRMMKKLLRQGRYACIVLEEDGHIAAYANFIWEASVGSVFLDYFAVDESQRGQGTGSRFLDMLKESWAQKKGIILECERPDLATSPQEREQRTRRIAFYERSGAQVTPLLWQAFGVDYNILYLPIEGPAESPQAIARDLTTLYSYAVPDFLLRKWAKLEGLEGAEE